MKPVVSQQSVAESKKEEMDRIINSIFRLPDQDEQKAIKDLILYLNQLLRIHFTTPPTSEVMIFLRHTKPKLFHSTRFALSKSSHLAMLFQIDGDLEIARKRLEELGVSLLT